MKNIRNQVWNAKDLQDRFFIRQDQITRYLAELKKEKVPSNDSYKPIYDQHLGEFQVFSGLSVTAVLHDRESLLAELRRLRIRGPMPNGNAYDVSMMTTGFNSAIDRLTVEFSGATDNTNVPSIEQVRALDGKIFAMLSDQEREIFDFYRDQGRKFGVTLSVINKADPELLASAASQEHADQIMKSANSVISVTILAA